MPDEKVQAAIQNWAPRFTTQGVDYNDFITTTRRIERWDEWCQAWCNTGNVHADLGMQAGQRGNTVSAGEAFIAAALCYHFGKFLFQDHPGEYLQAGRLSIEAFARGLRLLDPSGERIEIPFENGRMFGTLRRPEGDRAAPLVVLLPGLDSTKEEFFYWENVFLKRGLATISLEGPGQGECGYEMPVRPDYEAAVSAALDWLEKRRDIDMGRVGIAGVSLGGYYAPRAAAFEPRLRAAVGICGPWNFGECWDSLSSLTRAAFEYHSGAHDPAEAKERAGQLTLEDAAHRIRQPLLIIHGKLDRLIPWQQGEKIVKAAGRNAELALYENGSHVCNNIPYIYRPLAADWLREKLLDSPGYRPHRRPIQSGQREG